MQNRIFSFVLCYSWCFSFFSLRIESDAYDIRLINEYVQGGPKSTQLPN